MGNLWLTKNVDHCSESKTGVTRSIFFFIFLSRAHLTHSANDLHVAIAVEVFQGVKYQQLNVCIQISRISFFFFFLFLFFVLFCFVCLFVCFVCLFLFLFFCFFVCLFSREDKSVKGQEQSVGGDHILVIIHCDYSANPNNTHDLSTDHEPLFLICRAERQRHLITH